jgi:hypothetical protein
VGVWFGDEILTPFLKREWGFVLKINKGKRRRVWNLWLRRKMSKEQRQFYDL